MAEKIIKSEQQWKTQLTPQQYHVCREKGTESAFTGERGADSEREIERGVGANGREQLAGFVYGGGPLDLAGDVPDVPFGEQRWLARKRLNDATVRAPFDGAVGQKLVSAGQYIKENTAILTLVKTTPLRLRMDVPEGAAGTISNNEYYAINERNAQGLPV